MSNKEIAISIRNISKKYQLGKVDKFSGIRGLLRRFRKTSEGIKKNEFLALNDINCEIKKGEAIGIIGKNGAGKSTLLKILSRITPPTTGEIVINGRVASLLEVGTGFHPELTGKENIFLNGTILGMTRDEIEEKFEAIVDFSGVGKFLDTPVKRYSSGMYVRLAFAVAAHLEPEILIIDEVLAVGDTSFQKKCLGKMEESAKNGKTVLFVSHNLDAIKQFCPRSIYLHQGEVVSIGATIDIIEEYLQGGNAKSNGIVWDQKEVEYNDDVITLESAYTIDKTGEKISDLTVEDAFGICINYTINQEGFKPTPNLHLISPDGKRILVSIPSYDEKMDFSPGKRKTVVWIPENLLNEMTYIVAIGISTIGSNITHASDYSAFNITITDDLINLKTKNEFTGKLDAGVKPLLEWETQTI